MRISSWGWRGITALAVVAIAGLGGLLLGGPDQDDTGPARYFSSAEDAYRSGVKSLGDGKMADALPALEFAADRGVLGAQLQLSRIYSASGTAHGDDAKALTYYIMIVNQYGDIDRLHPAAALVSDAFHSLAAYYRKGVPAIGLKPDPRKAAQLIRHSASYFRDPRAQFEIGRMYAEGYGVARNRRLAISWLLKASQKKYAPAQAYLGEMLWSAKSGEHSRARGLALLALAVNNASEQERGGIEQRYHRAGNHANTTEITQAERFVNAWDGLHSGNAAHIVTARLKALRPTPLEAAPMGSLVVSGNDGPSTAQYPAADSPAGAMIGNVTLHLHGFGADAAPDATEPPPLPQTVERFFMGHPSVKAGQESSDLFAAVQIDRTSGQSLSVDASKQTK